MAHNNRILYTDYAQSNPNMVPKRDLTKVQISGDLYATLMMKDVGGGNKMQDLLRPSNGEVLTEYDKEKVLFTLDYLRIYGKVDKVIKSLDAADFQEIENNGSASDRADALVQVIIRKSQGGKTLTENQKTKMTEDINDYVNTMIRSKDNESFREVLMNNSLQKRTLSSVKHYGNEIKQLLKKCTNSNGEVDWEECYIDVIKYANYASINKMKLLSHRLIVPIKFSKRNIHSKVESSLRDFQEISENCKDAEVLLAIDYITNKLKEAYDYYKQKTTVSDATFHNLISSNNDSIRRSAT